jgi:hypothetical protein
VCACGAASWYVLSNRECLIGYANAADWPRLRVLMAARAHASPTAARGIAHALFGAKLRAMNEVRSALRELPPELIVRIASAVSAGGDEGRAVPGQDFRVYWIA